MSASAGPSLLLLFLFVLVALAPLPFDLRPRLARPAQRDRAAERLELDVRAAVAERERVPLARVPAVAGSGNVDRKPPL